MTIGTEKLEWHGYTMVKNFEDIFICFDRMYERDRRTTHRQTDTTYRPHLCIASRGKNQRCHSFVSLKFIVSSVNEVF